MKKKLYSWLTLIGILSFCYLAVGPINQPIASAVTQKKETGRAEGGIIVRDAGYRKCIGVEEYIEGVLATTIDIASKDVVLEAQAVLIRSSIYECHEVSNGYFLSEDVLGLQYLPKDAWKKQWAEAYEDNMKKVQQAVLQTKDLVICYEKKPIIGSYCALSPGKTQAVKSMPYMKVVDCEKNLLKESYQTQYVIRRQDEVEVSRKEEDGAIASVSVSGNEMDVYRFAKEYRMVSPFLYEGNRKNTLIAKGKGHGCGMDQNHANALCEKETMDFMELLRCFYQNISFEKISW